MKNTGLNTAVWPIVLCSFSPTPPGYPRWPTRSIARTMHPAPDSLFPPPPAPASALRNAGRPRFALTDDEARSLVMQLGDMRTRHANNPRQHRPFVHDFLRAVHHATGRIYSAGTYRKLLQAYAPERTPSTTTLETEKNLLEHELKSRAVSVGIAAATPLTTAEAAPPVPAPAPARETGLELQQIIGLLHHLSARLDQQDRAFAGQDRSAGLQAHNDYLRERLAVTEEDLNQTRAQAARIALEAQAATTQAEERARELAVLYQNVKDQAAALGAMAEELHGSRQFAMQAIDGVRGETRAAKERCAQLEQQLKDKEQQVDMYRQMAFSKGGPAR